MKPQIIKHPEPQIKIYEVYDPMDLVVMMHTFDLDRAYDFAVEDSTFCFRKEVRSYWVPLKIGLQLLRLIDPYD